MSLFRQTPPKNLSEWLYIATRDLVPSARMRIHAEIKAHYAEAVQHRVESGSFKTAAAGASLADLGRAPAAARRFGREYLTRNDTLAIAGIYRRSTRGHAIGAILLILVYACGFIFSPWTHQTGESLFAFGILYALDVPGVYFGERGPRNLAGIDPAPASLYRLLGNHFVANLVLGCFCLALVLGSYRSEAGDLSSVLLIVAVFAFSCQKLFRLRKKVQCSRENWKLLLPQSPVGN